MLYTRDSKQRITQVRTRATSTVTLVSLMSAMQYEPFAALKQGTYGNTLSFTANWGNDGRLASRRVYKTSGGANVSLLNYAYDNTDNMTGIADAVVPARSTTSGYDSVERLSRVDGNLAGGMTREDYVHDRNGNRSAVERRVNATDPAPAQTDAYTTAPGTNRLASVTTAAGTRAISYDTRGNTLGETRPGSVTVTATYDGHARLIGYTQGGTSLAHSYNGLDDRVATASGATTLRFVFDPGGRVIGEYGTSATDVKAEYLWLQPEAGDSGAFGGGDGTGGYTPIAIAQAPSGGTATLSWVHANHLGVPLTFTNASGTEVTPTGFTALGFPGQTRTLADLWHNRYRDYDPTTGRYIQADPIGLEGDANPYGYAENNPLTNIDPEGLETYWEAYTGLPDSTRVNAINAIAGASDAATVGLTYYARELLGANRDVRRNSRIYQNAEYAGIAIGVCLGGTAGWGAAGARGPGKEFSHWLPKRAGGVRTKWNGNFVKIRTHALSDPHRYRFMPKDWKRANPLPGRLQQQLVRVPRVYVGAAVGGAGAAGIRQ